MSGALSIGVVSDYLEEGWPSMDLAAELIASAANAGAGPFRAELLRPPMRRLLSRPPVSGGFAFNGDRALNRFLFYPRWLRTEARRHDLFHVVDHSYAHLALALPAGGTAVTCHDLDSFRVLWSEGGPAIHRHIAKRIAAGLRRAAVVICPSRATRDELANSGLVPAARIRVTPNPVHPCFESEPGPEARDEAARLLGGGEPLVLHAGSNIARKRIDVLLAAFALVRCRWPGARLVRTGSLTPAQRNQAVALGVAGALVELPPVGRETLAAIYSRAALTVLPSDREGFGWPMVESLARGVPVVATDLAVFRETGADSAVYACAGDPASFARLMERLLDERRARPESWEARRRRARARSEAFGMAAYARGLGAIYEELKENRKCLERL